MNDRIKLAEAMGWQREVISETCTAWVNPNGKDRLRTVDELPDPFTDANDDYAVLEWMRRGDGPATIYAKFKDAFDGDYIDGIGRWWMYEVGDYARAALKVLE